MICNRAYTTLMVLKHLIHEREMKMKKIGFVWKKNLYKGELLIAFSSNQLYLEGHSTSRSLTYIYIYTHSYLYTCMCMHTHTHVYAHACTCSCARPAPSCPCARLQAHMPAHAFTPLHPCARTSTRMHTCTHIHIELCDKLSIKSNTFSCCMRKVGW